jgi:hypothetical protein
VTTPKPKRFRLVVGAAVFLAAAAGAFMTGQTIVIDRGATIS